VKTEGISMGNLDAKNRVCCFSIGFDETSGFDESGMCFERRSRDDVRL